MKAGTTSLHTYLDLHPDVSMSQPKELQFFSIHWERGTQWYESHFREAPVRGEASPSYTKYPVFPGVPERMHRVIPDAKLIYVVRDPIDRILSQYVHDYADGRVDGDLATELRGDLAAKNLTAPSMYFTQLSRFLDHFPSERIHVATSDGLAGNRRATLESIFDFLGLDVASYPFPRTEHVLGRGEDKRRQPPVYYLRRAASERVRRTRLGTVLPARMLGRFRVFQGKPEEIPTPVLSDDQRTVLVDFLRDDIARFRELTGLDFPGWSV